jgi:hypothetical protein
MNWSPVSMIQACVSRSDGKGLSLMLLRTGPGRRAWQVVAAEATVPHDAENAYQGIAQTLDDHAHQLLEPQDSLAQAMAVAEKYAKWWQRSGATADACACVEIDAEFEPPLASAGDRLRTLFTHSRIGQIPPHAHRDLPPLFPSPLRVLR